MTKTSTDYLARISVMKTGYFDGLWSASHGQWEESGNGYTWLNAYMAQAIAILAGQGVASATDIARAVTVITKLAASPCYVHNTWTHLMDGSSDSHESVDQVVAEALYFAYKYRVALGLAGGTVTAIFNILTVNRSLAGTTINGAPATLYVNQTLDATDLYNNQSNSKWMLNRLTYGYFLGANLAAQLSLTLKRFIHYIDTAPGTGSPVLNPWLFADFTWRYTDSMAFPSFEYGEMAVGSAQLFYPDIAGALALTSDEINKMKAWQRCMLGQWQRNGYPNWDSGWSNSRMYTQAYWGWAIRALMGMVRGSALNQGANDALYAKWILDNVLDMLAYMDQWASDPADAVPKDFPLGTQFGLVIYSAAYNFSKASSGARFLAELAVCVDLGIADAASADPGNVWNWGWATKQVHVSTPFYDAASLPYAPIIGLDLSYGADSVQNQHWGISRIGTPKGEILTSLGGYGLESFSLQVSRSGVMDIDTSSVQPATQQVYIDDVQQTRVDYDVSSISPNFTKSLRNYCSKAGTNYGVEVDTVFGRDHICSTHRVNLTGSTGPASVVLSVPARKNAVIDYVSVTDVKTVVWNGTTVVAAGSPDPTACKYIHIKWASRGAGLLIVPRAGVVGVGAKVTALSYTPGTYPKRAHDQDRSLLIYLADTTVSNVPSVSITHDFFVTDGTDAGAEAVYASSLFNGFNYRLPLRNPANFNTGLNFWGTAETVLSPNGK